MNLSPIVRSLRILLLAALLVGGLAGWFSILTQDGTENVAQAAAQFFLGLGIVLPVTLVGYTRFVEAVPDRQSLVAIALSSSVLGIIAFIILATLIAGSVGGEDLNQVRIALGSLIPIWQMLAVVVVQVVVSLVIPIQSDKKA